MAAAAADSVAEAKHRRATAAVSAPLDAATSARDEEKKQHRTLFGAGRTLIFSLAHRLRRRRPDVLGCSAVLLTTVVGYLYATIELLHPEDAASVQAASFLGHILFVWYVLNTLAVIWHGPGRVPKLQRGQGWQPAPEVEAALEVGRHSPYRPFHGYEEWCFECNHWKAPLVHHCSVCNRCSVWMDHHCNLLGQCIGFRNYRCFLCWMASVQVLLVYAILISLQCLCLSTSTSSWFLGRVLLFNIVMVYELQVANSHFRFALLKLSLGWPSGVLHAKFTQIASEAQQTVGAYGDMPAPTMQALKIALQGVLFPQGGLRGLFYNGGRLGNLAVVFGEPLGLRWLLPLRAGGRGDPLKPKDFCEESCKAWAALEEALTAHQTLMAQVHQLMAVREQMAAAHHSAMLEKAQTLQDTMDP